VAGGEGLARYEGVPLFIPRSVPGDRLRVRIVERRPDYGRAAIVAIVAPGPGRRPDPVPELAHWGGCDLQHIEDGLQSRLKATAVVETLAKMGKVVLPDPAALDLITGEPWHYRLRTQLHTDVQDGIVRVGYHARGTNELLPVFRCPLLVPELEVLLPNLAGRLGEPPPRRLDLAAGDAGDIGAVGDAGGITAAPLVPDLPHGPVNLTVGEIVYSYDARCFFQGHRGLLPRLVETTVGPWSGGEAYDLYCGAGLFALALGRRYGRVVGVEGERIAARYARTNARRNRLPHVEVVSQALESWIEKLPQGVARVIVDPPRAGLTPAVRRVIVERRPERLTYVSCHPAALARDLRQLTLVYALESLTLIDMFPQTGHMETVAQLVLR
jgi:23S rRNA (uracil1939-C5)-methyltransferase